MVCLFEKYEDLEGGELHFIEAIRKNFTKEVIFQ